jgi:hypothetical protein
MPLSSPSSRPPCITRSSGLGPRTGPGIPDRERPSAILRTNDAHAGGSRNDRAPGGRVRQRSIFAGRLASPWFDPDAAHPRSAPDHIRARHRRRLRRHADYRNLRTARQRRDDAHRPLPLRLDRNCCGSGAAARGEYCAAAPRRDRAATRANCRHGCRGLRADRHRRAHRDHRPLSRRRVLRCPDAQAAAPSLRRARSHTRRCVEARSRGRGPHRRQPAVRVAGRHARCRASFLRRRRREALHGSHGAAQAQYSAPASVGRSGLADRDQVMAEPGDRGRPERSRRRSRRLLHAAGLQ